MLIIERKSGPNAVDHGFEQALTRKEAAAMLKLHITTLERWAAAGEGPKFVKVGDGPRARVRYPLRMLNSWLRGKVR